MADPRDPGAQERIAELVAARDTAALLSLLARRHASSVRHAAARALLAIGDGAALDALGGLLAAPEPGLSDEVLGALVELAGPNAARVLARGLAAPDPFWRYKAIGALARRAEPESLGLLLPAFRDESSPIRRFAGRIVERALHEAPERVAGLAPGRIDQIFEALALDAERARGRLGGGPLALRCAAARRLARLGGRAAWESLAAACASTELELVETALSALEAAQEAPAELFRGLAGHERPCVRRRALAALASREGGAPREVERALEDPAGEVREAALSLLAERSGADALELLAPLAADPEPAIRRALLRFLAGWPAERTAGLLRAAADDPDEVVRRRALVALARAGAWSQKLGERYAALLADFAARPKLEPDEVEGLVALAETIGARGGAQAEQALGAFVAAGRSAALRLRRVALEAIGRFPPALRREGLAALADTHDKVMLRRVALELAREGDRRGFVPLVRVIYEIGGRPGDEARGLLGQYPRAEELEFQISALSHRSSAMKRFAAERLRDSGDPRAVDPLVLALDDPDLEVQLVAVLALAKFAAEERVAQRLMAAIDYGDLTVRQLAVEALGEAKVAAAVPDLIRALANPFLRLRAEEALKRIGDRKGHLAVRRMKIREKHFPRPAARERARRRAKAQEGEDRPATALRKRLEE